MLFVEISVSMFDGSLNFEKAPGVGFSHLGKSFFFNI